MKGHIILVLKISDLLAHKMEISIFASACMVEKNRGNFKILCETRLKSLTNQENKIISWVLEVNLFQK